MQLTSQLDNLNPLRNQPGKIPLPVLLRNSIFDVLFYDTPALGFCEKLELIARFSDYDEGGMLLVRPRDAASPIEYYDLSHDLLRENPDLDAVVIPGVGSSPLGAAALARQVADAINRPVVGIIAGYGAADMMSEALGGWFDFGLRNRAQALVAAWRRQFSPLRSESGDLLSRYKLKSTTFLVDEPESNTLINILLQQGHKLRLLVGHSKGSLNIQNACNAVVRETELDPAGYAQLRVVTFGCGVTLPAAFSNLHQYVGTWDLLGRLNTPLALTFDSTLGWIEHRAHNLVSSNPLHMPVEALLAEALRLNRPAAETRG